MYQNLLFLRLNIKFSPPKYPPPPINIRQNSNLWCCLKILSLFFRTLFFTWCAFMLWGGAIFKCMLLPSFGDSPHLINVLNFPVFLDPFPYGINRFFLENGETNCIPQLTINLKQNNSPKKHNFFSAFRQRK